MDSGSHRRSDDGRGAIVSIFLLDRNGTPVGVGDYIRIEKRVTAVGPPIGDVAQVLEIKQGMLYVAHPKSPTGQYGKLPANVTKVYEPDMLMDLGL